MTTAELEAPRARTSRTGDGRALVVLVLAVATLAWLWLALRPGHDHGFPDLVARTTHGHHDHTHTDLGPDPVGPLLTWLAGWVVMVVAMMLPPALPLLRTVRRLTARRARPLLLLAACTAGFVLAWTLAGVVLVAAATWLELMLSSWHWLGEHPGVPSGLAAIGAGAYQLTPLKAACLTACRSPLGLVATTWTGTRGPAVESALVGLRFGAVCVGCCWALMTLTLVVGVAALPLMALVGALMAAERLLPRVRALVPAVAVGAMALGVLLLAGVITSGVSH